MIFKTNRDGTILFAPNGVWSKMCYVLPDEKYKRRIKSVAVWDLFLLIVVAIIAKLLESWALFFIGIVVLAYLKTRIVKRMCRHCQKIEARITYKDQIWEFASSRKLWELWLTSVSLPLFAMLVLLKIFAGSKDIVQDVFGVILFILLSTISIHALVLRLRK